MTKRGGNDVGVWWAAAGALNRKPLLLLAF